MGPSGLLGGPQIGWPIHQSSWSIRPICRSTTDETRTKAKRMPKKIVVSDSRFFLVPILQRPQRRNVTAWSNQSVLQYLLMPKTIQRRSSTDSVQDKRIGEETLWYHFLTKHKTPKNHFVTILNRRSGIPVLYMLYLRARVPSVLRPCLFSAPSSSSSSSLTDRDQRQLSVSMQSFHVNSRMLL